MLNMSNAVCGTCGVDFLLHCASYSALKFGTHTSFRNLMLLDEDKLILAVDTTGDEQDMRDLFAAEEPSGLNKHELYKQNKEAQMMERLERRMEGIH